MTKIMKQKFSEILMIFDRGVPAPPSGFGGLDVEPGSQSGRTYKSYRIIIWQTLFQYTSRLGGLPRWQTADSRIRFDEEQIAELEAAMEKTKLLVRYTSSTYLEVLTAQQSLLEARLTLAQDYIDKVQAIISLYHALGGGVE